MEKEIEEMTIDEVLAEIRTYPASILMAVSTHILQDYYNRRVEDLIDEMFTMNYSAAEQRVLAERLVLSFKGCFSLDEAKEMREFKINRAKELIKEILHSKRVEPENPEINLETSKVHLSEVEGLIAKLVKIKDTLEKENDRWYKIESLQRHFLLLCRYCQVKLQKNYNSAFLNTYDDVIYFTKELAITYKDGHEGLAYKLCEDVKSVEELLA